MINRNYESIREFWTAPTMKEAKSIIHPAEDWESPTNSVMPCIITTTVRKLLGEQREFAVEIGAGVGRLVVPMAGVFGQVVGVDICPKMVDLSKEYIPKSVQHLARVVLTDGKTLDFQDNAVDFVYSVICFQHIPTREMIQQYLRESYRILRPGGVLRVQTMVGTPEKEFDGIHGYFYADPDLLVADSVDAGFMVIERDVGLFHEQYVWVTAVKRK